MMNGLSAILHRKSGVIIKNQKKARLYKRTVIEIITKEVRVKMKKY